MVAAPSCDLVYFHAGAVPASQHIGLTSSSTRDSHLLYGSRLNHRRRELAYDHTRQRHDAGYGNGLHQQRRTGGIAYRRL